MSKYATNQYVRILDKLPQEIRDAVASSDTVSHIWKIGQKHNLHIDKLGILSDLAYDVMMGIVSTKNFVQELSGALEIPMIEASILARDIDENIFRPIKQIMVSLYGEGAPNKPSSSLVQAYEEEEDHPALLKDTLLKEIEDPAPSQVKKEVTENTSLEAKKLRSLGEKNKSTEILKQETSQEVSEYHQEIENPKLESLEGSSKVPNQIQKNENFNNSSRPLSSEASKLESGLNKLAEMKLSKTFIMPKTTSGEGEELLAVREEKPELKSSEEKENKNTTAEKPTNTPQAPKIDPYREQI